MIDQQTVIGREPGVELWNLRGAGLPTLDRECTHAGAIPAVAPALDRARAERVTSVKLRVPCPDCWFELDLRLWRPEAGDWYLRLQERFVAGRGWNFRYEAGRWVIGS